MLKITFHSYQNPSHRCGECLDPYPQGPVCCNTADQFDNCSSVCQLRLVASVEPFNSSWRDVFFPRIPPSFWEDEVEEFPVGPFNNTEGNISNPFIANMSIWTVSLLILQLNSSFVCRARSVVWFCIIAV